MKGQCKHIRKDNICILTNEKCIDDDIETCEDYEENEAQMNPSNIREILLNLIERITEDGLSHKTTFESIKQRVDDAFQSIYDYLSEKMPKKRKTLKSNSDNQRWFDEGYNQALVEVQSILKQEIMGE